MKMDFKKDSRSIHLKAHRPKGSDEIDSKEALKVFRAIRVALLCMVQTIEQAENEEEAVPPELEEVLREFKEVFAEPTSLPLKRSQDYHITLIMGCGTLER
jgi:hypothetical protein